ncbi:hypothetical protein NPIL_529721, partial [Nephila pilipes]
LLPQTSPAPTLPTVHYPLPFHSTLHPYPPPHHTTHFSLPLPRGLICDSLSEEHSPPHPPTYLAFSRRLGTKSFRPSLSTDSFGNSVTLILLPLSAVSPYRFAH